MDSNELRNALYDRDLDSAESTTRWQSVARGSRRLARVAGVKQTNSPERGSLPGMGRLVQFLVGVSLIACSTAQQGGTDAPTAGGARTDALASGGIGGRGNGGTATETVQSKSTVAGSPTTGGALWTGGTKAIGGSGTGGTLVATTHSGGTRVATAGTSSTVTTTTTGGASGSGGGASGGVATGSGGGASGGVATGSGGLATGGAGGTRDAGTDTTAASVIDQLKVYLAVPRAQRKPIAGEGFAQTPISRDEAAQASELLWQDFTAQIKATRKAEHDARAITLDGKTLRFVFKTFGTKPTAGRSLFISLHGGGNAAASVNDEQWVNQQTLYQPAEGIYLAPRAPTDTWNLWHEAHIDPLFERLITNLIVFEGVNPDRVYVMGYSAGGDGVYQLGPRMADSWAAAAAMAGHPNDAQPLSLRNIGFTIHVGALDTSYDRNLVAQQWEDQLDELEAADPGAYPHVVQVHAGKPHWMDLEDAVAVPWMADFTRNPTPTKVVWYQDDVPHARFYWLAVDAAQAKAKTEVRATLAEQSVTLDSANLTRVKVRLSDAMLDLDRDVTITANGHERWNGTVSRTVAIIAKTLEERGDPRMVFTAEASVTF